MSLDNLKQLEMAASPQNVAGAEINKKTISLDDYRWKLPCKGFLIGCQLYEFDLSHGTLKPEYDILNNQHISLFFEETMGYFKQSAEVLLWPQLNLDGLLSQLLMKAKFDVRQV